MESLLLVVLGVIVTTQAVIIPQETQPGNFREWKVITGGKFNILGLVCPGGASQCPEFATCCQMATGDWGCCPFLDAVCCTDKVHCCPKNNVCDLPQQRCTTDAQDPETSTKLMQKFIWKTTPGPFGSLGSITCPDGQSECPDSTTCCQMTTGEWGCCPFASAICCSDKLHCCPKDTVCNLAEQRCQKSLPGQDGTLTRNRYTDPRRLVAGVIKMHPVVHNVTDNICPDYHTCHDDTTCCRMKSGKYGCCPFPKADCCSDGLHCCQIGSKCDVISGKCA